MLVNNPPLPNLVLHPPFNVIIIKISVGENMNTTEIEVIIVFLIVGQANNKNRTLLCGEYNYYQILVGVLGQ